MNAPSFLSVKSRRWTFGFCGALMLLPTWDLLGQEEAVDGEPPVNLIHVRDPRIEEATRDWRARSGEMQGFRIQLFTGTLQDARLLRSQLRDQTHLPVYLTSLPPNYQILLGDFRDRWSAEKERELWLATFPYALVLASPVALPHGPRPQEPVVGELPADSSAMPAQAPAPARPY